MASSLNKRLRDLDKKPKSSGPPIPGQRDSEEVKPIDGIVFMMLALTGLLALVVFAVVFGVRTIEQNLQDGIAAQLRSGGAESVEVRASGRHVLVAAVVQDEETIERIVEYVSTYPGVTSFETNLVVAVDRGPIDIVISSEPWVLAWDRAGATMTGTASTVDVQDAIMLSLNDTFSNVDATGFTIREGIGDERDWLSAFFQLTTTMVELTPEGSIFASPDDRLFKVTAEFETRPERSSARQAAQDIVSATTFEFSSGLTYEDAPPPPREEQVIELQENIDELIEGKVVEFETDSEVITPVGTALLDEILEALRKFPDVSIEIAGHTDDQGSEDYNNDLSRRRADAVLAYLVNRGEPTDRFVVVGYGESRPVADNGTAEGRARNRRIEFKALLEG